MALQDFVKDKEELEQQELNSKIISTYKKNANIYASSSTKWIVGVTADELGISEEQVTNTINSVTE